MRSSGVKEAAWHLALEPHDQLAVHGVRVRVAVARPRAAGRAAAGASGGGAARGAAARGQRAARRRRCRAWVAWARARACARSP